MRISKSARVAGAVAALVLVGGVPGIGSEVGASTQPHATARPRWRRVTWSNAAPPIVIGAPACGAGGRCLYPWTETGTSTGDLVGSYQAAGVATANAAGLLMVSRTDVFTGTVKGCGTGSITFHAVEEIGPHAAPARWSTVNRFGTGALAHLRAYGTGSGAQSPTGVTSTLVGRLRCNP